MQYNQPDVQQDRAFMQRPTASSALPKSRASVTNAIVGIVALTIAIVLAVSVPHFMEPRNILDILGQLSLLGFMAIGMTYVMALGGVDLSMCTVVSAAAVVGATAMVSGYPPVAGCFLMLAVGMAFGAVNGAAIAFGRMTPFIVTLSTMVLAQGFAIWFTSAESISDLPESYLDVISAKLFGIVPVPALLIILTAIVSGLVLARTEYGRWIYLIGTNEKAARISGIPVRRAQFATYVVSGLLAGLTAIVVTAILGTATTSMVREERLLDVIATAVIGGASLAGGAGTILGTMLGLLFITVLGNAFNLLGVSPFAAMVIKGVVLVAVIGLDVLRNR